ncbi:MAG: NUMOD3 domain-containing DNA-binding protein [Methanobacterium sp.]
MSNQIKTFVVYCHTSPSGKKYIGITSNYKRRCYRHSDESSSCTAFSYAIKKYGWDNFKHEILANGLTLQSANHFEQFYIKYFNTISPNGYNLKTGGDMSTHCHETRKKISDANSGEKHPFFGKFGSDHPRYGMRNTPETKARMSESQKGEKSYWFGKRGAESKASKTYLVINPDGVTEIAFGLKQYCDANGLSRTHMAHVAQGKRLHHKKYYCEYIYEDKYTEDEIRNIGYLWSLKIDNHVSHKSGVDNKSAKKYKITKPNGDIIIIKNLKHFCRENNLHAAHMCGVANGKLNHHKKHICEHYE